MPYAFRPPAGAAGGYAVAAALQQPSDTLACPPCEASAAGSSAPNVTPVEERRRRGLIQHKREAYWFYRFLSIVYDTVVNPFHWTVEMRDASLRQAGLEAGTGQSPEAFSVVDVGGGTGFCTEGVVKYVAPACVTLLDQSPHQMQVARRKPTLQGVKLVQGDAEALPFPTDTFDRYVSAGSIEYWPEPQRGVAEAYRSLLVRSVDAVPDRGRIPTVVRTGRFPRCASVLHRAARLQGHSPARSDHGADGDRHQAGGRRAEDPPRTHRGGAGQQATDGSARAGGVCVSVAAGLHRRLLLFSVAVRDHVVRGAIHSATADLPSVLDVSPQRLHRSGIHTVESLSHATLGHVAQAGHVLQVAVSGLRRCRREHLIPSGRVELRVEMRLAEQHTVNLGVGAQCQFLVTGATTEAVVVVDAAVGGHALRGVHQLAAYAAGLVRATVHRHDVGEDEKETERGGGGESERERVVIIHVHRKRKHGCRFENAEAGKRSGGNRNGCGGGNG
eukprot:ctg_2849.g534